MLYRYMQGGKVILRACQIRFLQAEGHTVAHVDVKDQVLYLFLRIYVITLLIRCRSQRKHLNS